MLKYQLTVHSIYCLFHLSFIHSFYLLFNQSLVLSINRLFIRSNYSFYLSFICSVYQLFYSVYLSVYPIFIHIYISLVCSIYRLFTCSLLIDLLFVHSIYHAFIHSFYLSFICSFYHSFDLFSLLFVLSIDCFICLIYLFCIYLWWYLVQRSYCHFKKIYLSVTSKPCHASSNQMTFLGLDSR